MKERDERDSDHRAAADWAAVEDANVKDPTELGCASEEEAGRSKVNRAGCDATGLPLRSGMK